jgi:hypothetical protein
MIRINLLPATKRVATASGSAQLWAAIYMLGVFAWGVLLFFVLMSVVKMLDEV